MYLQPQSSRKSSESDISEMKKHYGRWSSVVSFVCVHVNTQPIKSTCTKCTYKGHFLVESVNVKG